MAEVFDRAVRRPLLEYVPIWVKPNHLSALRAILVGPFLYCYFHNLTAMAIFIVLLSSLCDLLDGPLARVRRETSQTGAVLDATSDKIFILCALYFGRTEATGDLIITVIVMDVLLTVMRPIKRYFKVKTDANSWGGAKVWFQTAAIILSLLRYPWAAELITPTLSLAIICAFGSLFGHIDDICRKR